MSGDHDHQRDGLPLSLDPEADSADTRVPGFLARPDGAPVYHGFAILEGVEADGFRLGTIIALGPEDYGDAFVIAPDGSRAGLVWEVGSNRQLQQVSGFEPDRWGVWAVEFSRPMESAEAARRNLEEALPALREKWAQWKSHFGSRGGTSAPDD
jgi:hypothetical protein